ncbi:CoA-transferase [Nocardia harenae]|uniref:CoA-transferase n=1 Tax=Nocardia harenae TaxID=358707 RepID=UPI00082BFE4B|nr:CoA-transferase [Nocardia harenae]
MSATGTPAYSPADLIAIELGRRVVDGSVVGCGAFTPLAMAATMWAKAGHAGNAILYPISFNATRVDRWFPLSYSHTEGMALVAGQSLPAIDLFDLAQHRGMDFELVLPLQVDAHGNINSALIGDPRKPKLRGPGSNGIDALCVMDQKVTVYVTDHSTRTFVPEVDFVSGAGDATRRGGKTPGGIGFVVTNLCTMELAEGRWLLRSVHPGVEVEDVRAATGFEIETADDLATTTPPTKQELDLLDAVDPLGIRELDLLSGVQRRRELARLLRREDEYFTELLARVTGRAR